LGNRFALVAVGLLLLCGDCGSAWSQDDAAGEAGPETTGGEDEGTPRDGGVAQRFDIWEYRVTGESPVTPQDIERAVYPYLGPDKSIEDVEAARTGIERLHRDKGYATVVVNIPEQDVAEGVVRLDILPGQVDRLRITGSRYFSLGRIRSKVPSLAVGAVPYLPAVQRDLVALNRLSPDRSITPVLRPGRTPGKLEVELMVEDQLPLHGSIELNDRYTRDTTELRLSTSLRYDNLWQREHSAGLSYQVAPQDVDDVQTISGTYVFKLPDSDKVVALYGVGTTSDVTTIGTLGVVGEGQIFGARFSIPLPLLGRYVHNVSLGFDYKDFGETVNLLGADALNTPISYSMFVAEYSSTLFGESATTRASVGASFAIRGFGNTQAEFERKRFQAEPNFFYLTVGAEREQRLPLGAQFVVSAQGQFAGQPLISNEQFSMGGVGSLRGYLESQQFVDDGVRTSLELRSPSFGAALWDAIKEFRFLAFVEAAKGKIYDPLPSQKDSFFLWSAGVGMRFATLEGLAAHLDWGYPFKDSFDIKAGDARLHFSLEYAF
jgi:hemolysin activation/secretion protein